VALGLLSHGRDPTGGSRLGEEQNFDSLGSSANIGTSIHLFAFRANGKNSHTVME